MINVQFMKPFYTKVSGSKLRLVFAYQYFSIIKDDEVFHFIPIEGKEIIVNLYTGQVENLSEVFVFQRGNRFIRMPLHQLLDASDVEEFIKPIIESASGEVEADEDCVEVSEDAKMVPAELDRLNLLNAIDKALDERDEALFMELTNKLQELETISGG